MKNKKRGGGGMGVKREGDLLSKLSSTEKEGYLSGEALIEDLRCCYYCFFFCLSDVKKSINPALIASKR